MLDKLVDNISMLSSVYFKVPESFVKKIRDRINERLDLENEFIEVKGRGEEDYVDSQGVKKSEYIKEAHVESYHNYIQGTGDLLGVEEDSGPSNTPAIDDLLSSTPTTKEEAKANGGNLLDDLLDTPTPSAGANSNSLLDLDSPITGS